MLKFEFSGRYHQTTDVALPAMSSLSTVAPMVLQGGEFSVGGDTMNINKLSLTPGAAVAVRPSTVGDGGLVSYVIGDFDPELNIDPEADLVANFDFMDAYVDSTELAVAFMITDGTVDIDFSLPKVQIKTIESADREGILANDIVCQCNNNGSTPAILITAAAQ
jgi:hypothetical protein